MKRKISVFLAVVMTFALSSPVLAFADEDSYDYYLEEEVITEGYYVDDSAEKEAWIATWAEENPELAAEILADDPPLWQNWGYESINDFMLDYGLDSEEEYYDFVLEWYAEDYYYEYIWEVEAAENIRNTRLSMGGTEEGLAVLYNGTYLSFPVAQPEKTDGRTMVPIRAFIEAIGGQLEYLPDTGSVTLHLKGIEMNFVIGSDTLEANSDGETWTINMDCASYVKDGVAYVPVRSICEVVGYDVYWDSAYETAVILDRSAIISEIDANYSILNKLFTIPDTDPMKTYKAIGNILVSYTELNSLDGDQTGDITVNMEAIINGLNEEMTITADVSQILELLMETDNYYFDAETLASLSGTSELFMDLILNMDEGCMYIKSNLFPLLDISVDEDTWIMFGSDYIGSVMDAYEDLLSSSLTSSETATIGSIIYSISPGVYSSSYDSESVFLYSDMMETAGELAFLGDSMFVKNGNTYTLNISLDNYDAFLPVMYGADYDESDAEDFLDSFKEFDVTLNITDNDGIVSADGDFNIRENPDYSWSDTRYSGSFSISAEKVAMELEIHEKNAMKLLVSIDFAIAETSETVSEAPPAGSTVIDADDVSYIGF